SLPARRIVEHLRRRSLPACLSRNAGGYLCNAVLYHSLQSARGAEWQMRSGFVHLPATLGSRSRPAVSRLSWDEALDGSLEIIATALGAGGRQLGVPRSETGVAQRLAPRPRTPQAGSGKPTPVG